MLAAVVAVLTMVELLAQVVQAVVVRQAQVAVKIMEIQEQLMLAAVVVVALATVRLVLAEALVAQV